MKFATSKNLTILGVLVILAGLIRAAIAVLDGDPTTSVNVTELLVELGTGVGFILGKGAQSTGGSVPETPEAAKRIGSGFARLGLLAILAVLLGGAVAARAEGPLSACNEKKSLCWGPAATVSVGAYSMTTGKFSAGFTPGIGYGATFWADKPYAVGFAGYLALRPALDGRTDGLVSVMVSVLSYLRIGYAKQILGPTHENFLLIGAGL